MEENDTKAQDREALLFHTAGRPGKIEITPTKPLTTQRDLSLAYSPVSPPRVLPSPKMRQPLTTTPPKAIWWR